MTLDMPHLTLIFMATVCALAMAFVWMFVEFEKAFGKRLVTATEVRLRALRGERAPAGE